MRKKYCSYCGCIMDQKHDGDVCECCLDDLYESDPGEDEPGYPCLSYYDEHDAREDVEG